MLFGIKTVGPAALFWLLAASRSAKAAGPHPQYRRETVGLNRLIGNMSEQRLDGSYTLSVHAGADASQLQVLGQRSVVVTNHGNVTPDH
jgi:hypothetical protein